MPRYDHVWLVCTNDRGADSPKKSCAQAGGAELLACLKVCGKQPNARGRVRVVAAGCLGLCQKGCVVGVFSQALPSAQTWYSRVRPEDAEALFDAHVAGGKPLAHLVEPDQAPPPP